MKIKSLFILSALLPFVTFAETNQLLSEQDETLNYLDSHYQKHLPDETFISGGAEESGKGMEKNYKEVDGNNSHLDTFSEDILGKDQNQGKKAFDRGIMPLGATDHYENYLAADYDEINKRLNNKSPQAFKFAYLFKNQTEFSNSSNTFEKTFHQGPDRAEFGQILFGYERYINRRFTDFFWGLNTGLSFFRGYGKFKSDNAQSDAAINLWAVPLDLGLGLSIPLGTWVSVSAMGGPSVLGLFQTRSDRSQDEKGKRANQLGTGFFADGQLRFSLSNIWPSSVFSMYSGDGVTKVWLNLEGRYQSYTKFPEEGVQVVGSSYGVSFTFEYL